MNRHVVFAPSEFYHVYNRGVDKRVIFTDHSDYKRFIKLLFFCNSLKKVEMREVSRKLYLGITLGDFIEERGETLVDIGAFCLMPNHFHLLMHEKGDGGVTLFLKKLCTAYSMYFNAKNTRTGKLFERAFQAEHANSDNYLKYLFSYIHLNPAKIIDPNWKERAMHDFTKIGNFVEKYEFSSYRNYLGDVENIEIMNKLPFPDYFGGDESRIRKEINEWLSYKLPR